MTLDQMRYFLEAAKFEHVGKAAKSVHISPSAVSSAIAALESDLGCSLFDRQGKSIRLTEHGRFLKTRIERIFDDISSIESGVRASSAALSGTYRLGGSPFLTTRILAPTWFALQKKHPALVGELSSLHTSRLISEVLSGSLDLALCFSPLQHPELKQIDLFTGQLRLMVRKGHPVLKEKTPLKKLSEFPATIHKSSPGVDLCENHPAFEQFGIVPQISCLFDNDEIAVQNLTSSDSWSLLPDFILKNSLKTLVAVPVPPAWDAPYSISAVLRSHRAENPVLKLLREKLAKSLGSAPVNTSA